MPGCTDCSFIRRPHTELKKYTRYLNIIVFNLRIIELF